MPLVFEQFYLACLSHASYVIASEGVAAVVDPQRDVDIYLDFARERELEIRHIIETHLHADFVSGHGELAARTGAAIYLGEGSGATFAHRAVKDGDEIRFGQCVLRVLQTPGHTIESISVAVVDLERSPDPFAVLTGDTLFIGDVGRPDLSPAHTPQQLASMLYDSLHEKLLRLADDVEVYPAHGAGSLCGRQMSTERKSTIGIQRATNYALRAGSREKFIELMTADLPARPDYFLKDVELNRTGAAPLAALPQLPELTPEAVLEAQRAGAVVLDTRSPAEFGAAHIPGSVNIGLSGQYASWAAIVLPWDARIVIVAEDSGKADEARMRLARVGLEGVIGSLAGGVPAWARAGFELDQIPNISVSDLESELQGEDPPLAVDVRRPSEWEGGHVPDAVFKPLDKLTSSLDGLDREARIAVYCKGGYRSAIAASLLRRAGFRHVMNVTGGYDAWCANRGTMATSCQ